MGGVNVEVSSLSVPISPPICPRPARENPRILLLPHEDIVLGPMMR